MKKNGLIQKAVIPVAGLGTRMLPATKANPKEMLPIAHKTLIQDEVGSRLRKSIQSIIDSVPE